MQGSYRSVSEQGLRNKWILVGSRSGLVSTKRDGGFRNQDPRTFMTLEPCETVRDDLELGDSALMVRVRWEGGRIIHLCV